MSIFGISKRSRSVSMANCYFAKPQGMQHCYIPFFMLLISNALLVLARHRPAPSLCGGSVDSRAAFLRAKFFFETRPGTVHVLCEHFRGSTNQHAIPNRRTSAKEKEILLVWCTTIWRTTIEGQTLLFPGNFPSEMVTSPKFW